MGLFRILGGAAAGFLLGPAGGLGLAVTTILGGLGAEVAGQISDDDMETKARMEGYENGFKEAEVATAKKLAAVLEKDDDLKKSVLALGICVANIDNVIVDEEKEEIQLMVGQLDSSLVSEKLKQDYKKILEEKPNFAKVKREYLINVSDEHLRELDTFVQDIINADGKVTKEEEHFYKDEWIPYMKERGVRV